MSEKQSNKYLNKRAFTLAEVLITLAVIGIVAAMSIPSLMNNINDKHLKTKWKKAYADLSLAYMNVKQDNGGTLVDYFGEQDKPGDLRVPLINQFNKIRKNTASTLLSSLSYSTILNYDISYKTLDGSLVDSVNLVYGNMLLADGSHVFFRTYGPDHALIWVDVNGAYNQPNVVGKDMFGAVFTKDWIKPMGAPELSTTVGTCNTTPKTCTGFGFHNTPCAGVGCSAEYLIK